MRERRGRSPAPRPSSGKRDHPFIMLPDDNRNLVEVPDADHRMGSVHSISDEETDKPLLYIEESGVVLGYHPKRRPIGFKK